MRPVQVKQSGVGSSAPVALDQYISPFEVSLACVVTGTVSYSVNVSYDPTAPVTWFPVSSLQAQTANAAASLNGQPALWVQLVVASGTGSVEMTVLQAGIT